MLVILMAIIDFSRVKLYAATRWLWIALSGGMFVAAPLGCGAPLYGPMDANQGGEDLGSDNGTDPGVQPLYGAMEIIDDAQNPQDNMIEDFQVLYGPPPDYIQGDLQPEYGPPVDVYQDNIQPLYGAVDFIDESQVPDVDEVQDDAVTPDIQILYGPPAM